MRSMFIPKPWSGLRFQVPYPPASPSRACIALGIRDRGGTLVCGSEPADVVVLPEEPVPSSRAGRWLETGAIVMWERAFLRALNHGPAARGRST